MSRWIRRHRLTAFSAAERLDPGAGRGVHNRAAPALHQQRDLVLHAQEHPAHVDVEDPVPLVLSASGLTACSTPALLTATSRPERVNHLIQRRLHLLRPADVTLQGEHAAAGLLDQPGRLLYGLLGDVRDRHVGARLRERVCRRAPDTAARAGHERASSPRRSTRQRA
jgi:hypothetical protein